jgi:hypothetical protein
MDRAWPTAAGVVAPGKGPDVAPWPNLDLESGGVMTRIGRRIAQGLVATILLCAVGFMVCGSMSSPGNAWERACIVLVVVMLSSMLGAVGLVGVTYLKLRADVREHRGRPPVTDEEFAAMLPDPSTLDLDVLGLVRSRAAGYFRSLGGDRFYPGDRLGEDLHLRDLAPFASKAFCAELEETLGIQEDGLLGRIADGQLATFGDLITAASALADRSRQADGLAAHGPSNPL